MRAMPIIIQDGKFLELRNSSDEAVLPAMELKSGEDMREAAKRAADAFFGLEVPDGAIKEGFQARVGTEVVALYPVDASKMDMSLLRPAEEAATWAWKDVPESMGQVIALGFPRNLGERRNATDLIEDEDGTRAGAGVARTNAPYDGVTTQAQDLFHRGDRVKTIYGDQATVTGAYGANVTVKTDKGREEQYHPTKVFKNSNTDPVTARALIRQNDATEDAGEAARLAEGVKHVSEDIAEGVEDNPSRDAALMHDLAEGIEHESREISGEHQNAAPQLTDFEECPECYGHGAGRYIGKDERGRPLAFCDICDRPLLPKAGYRKNAGPGSGPAGDALAKHLRTCATCYNETFLAGKKTGHETAERLCPEGKKLLQASGKENVRENALDFGALRDAYSKLEGIDPTSPAGEKFLAAIHSADDDAIIKLCRENIKFVTKLAINEATRRGLDWKGARNNEKDNDADAGSHGHEYPGTKEGPFPIVRCNGANTIATQETATDWRCEGCGEVISGPPKPDIIIEA